MRRSPEAASPEPIAEQWAIRHLIGRPVSVVFSFEFLLAALLCIGGYKAHPTFAFLFPVDGTLLVLAMTIIVGSYIIAQRGIRIDSAFPLGLYALFCVWITSTILWTKEPTLKALSDYAVRVFLLNGVTLIGVLGIVAGSRARTIRFLVATAILAIPLALDYILSGGIAHRGSLEERNYLIIGRTVGTGFVIFFGFMVYARPFSTPWSICLAGSGIAFYAMLIIGSRQSFIAMIVQIAIILFMATYIARRSIKIRLGAVPAAIVVLVSLFGLALMVQSGVEGWTLRRMSSLLKFFSGDFQADDSAERRLDYLLAAFRYWSDSWWSVFFGDGLFSFSQQFRGIYLPGASPHNLVASILVEFGIVGLAIFTLLIVSLLVPGTLRIDKRSGLAAVLVALAVGTAFRTVASGDMANTVVLLSYLGLLASLRERVVPIASARVQAGRAGSGAGSLSQSARRPGAVSTARVLRDSGARPVL